MKHPKLKLSSFAALEACPRRPDGRYMAIQSLSDHLKNWEKTVADDPPTGKIYSIPSVHFIPKSLFSSIVLS